MKAWIYALVGLSTFAIQTQANTSLYKRYYSGTFTFDGKRVVDNPQGYAVDNKERWAKLERSGGTYTMNWSTEDNAGQEMVVINESVVAAKPNSEEKSIFGRTSSFVGNRLRSSTVCYGARGTTVGIQSNSLKCVTATRRACDRLLSSYDQEVSKNKDMTQGSRTTAGKVKETQAMAEKCMNFIDSFSAMGKAMANQSSQLKRQHDKVIDEDISRLKGHLKEDSSFLSFTSLKSAVSADELEKTASSYSGTVDGIRAMSEALQVCMESQNDFLDDTASNSSGSGSSSGGSRGSRAGGVR